MTLPSILSRIVEDKRREVEVRKAAQPLPAQKTTGPDFLSALRAAPMGLIAEVKHKSPSAGVIRNPFSPTDIARAYERAGAQALSVLMDEPYFGGGEAHFKEARAAVRLPMLYKEFVVDPWQVRHAAALGASAVLLIASVLSSDELREFMTLCARAGLAALVEVHDEEEMRTAVELRCPCIGVNNRNLKTFVTTLETTVRLARLAPRDALLVSESGIRSFEDVEKVRRAGAQAVLVGEHLLRQPDLEGAVRGLMGRP